MAVAVLVDADCWKALYLDGELIYQNHEIRADEMLGYLEGETVERYHRIFDYEHAENYSHYPDSFDELEITDDEKRSAICEGGA